MKLRFVFTVLAMLLMCNQGLAAEAAVEKDIEKALNTFAEGCQEELTTYCKDVTPGDGKILACLYAYHDKLSPQCEYGLYDSAAQLGRVFNDFSYAAAECRDDMINYCAEIKPGEGRMVECLSKHESKVSSRCNTALQMVGYK